MSEVAPEPEKPHGSDTPPRLASYFTRRFSDLGDVTPSHTRLSLSMTELELELDEANIEDILPPESRKRERWGWYSYDWANSVYSAIIISLFGPLLINGLATQKSYGANIQSCAATADTPDVNYTADTPDAFTIQNYKYTNAFDDLVYPPSCEAFNRVQPKEQTEYAPDLCLLCFAGHGNLIYDCAQNETFGWSAPTGAVDFGPFKVEAFAFTTFVLSLSVLFQAVMFIVTGPCADYGKNRKLFLIISAVFGIISSVGLCFVYDQNHYGVGGVFLILSNVGFGLSIVFYNAYLPLLVDAHPEVREEMQAGMKEGAADIEEKLHHKRDIVERKMSDFGFAAGYVAGLIVLVICVPIVFLLPNNIPGFFQWISYRLCIFIAAIWWAAFSIPTFLYVLPRPGPEFPASRCCGMSRARYLTFGVESLGLTLWQSRKYKHTLLFLVCYFIYSDSYNTMATVGVLFANDTLCMSSTSLIIVVIIIQVSAVAGIYFYQKIDHMKCSNLGAKGVILINLFVFLAICAYGLLGFIDAMPLGLKYREELYVYGFIYGFHLGAIQSYTRTTFGDMIPPGKEDEFFALYEISDKGSSWIGPIIVGIVYSATGSIRSAFVYLCLALIIPILMLFFCIDIRAGIEAVGKPDKAISPSKTTGKTPLSDSPSLVAEENAASHNTSQLGKLSVVQEVEIEADAEPEIELSAMTEKTEFEKEVPDAKPDNDSSTLPPSPKAT